MDYLGDDFLSFPLLNWDNEEAESSVRQVGSLGSQTVYNVCYPMKEESCPSLFSTMW